jgi:hypothetical protein
MTNWTLIALLFGVALIAGLAGGITALVLQPWLWTIRTDRNP